MKMLNWLGEHGFTIYICTAAVAFVLLVLVFVTLKAEMRYTEKRSEDKMLTSAEFTRSWERSLKDSGLGDPSEVCKRAILLGVQKQAMVEEVAEEDIPLIFDCPLSIELQQHLFAKCEEYDIDPAIILGIIQKESGFNIDAIGDNGRSFGLMQIQQRWHTDRMSKLGISNLRDAESNITVGIDFVNELFTTAGAYNASLRSLERTDPKLIAWVLMAYNGGPAHANRYFKNDEITHYATDVLAYADEYRAQDVYPYIWNH